MNPSKYLLIPLVAIAAAACTPKPQPANLGALKTTNTALILKTESANSAKATDSLSNAPAADADAKVVTKDQLIIPGKSIGQTSINESMETVFNRLGKPDSSDAAMGSALAVWYAGHNKTGYKTSIFSRHNYNGKDNIFQYVRRVLVTSPYFKTKEGIGAGSTLDQIKQDYTLNAGNSYIEKGKQMSVYDDVAKGISFEVDPAANKCVGVIIQKPGDAAGSYLNMN